MSLFLADSVEKSLFGNFRAADAFRAQRYEGPHRFTQKRPRSFVSALRSIAVADPAKNQLLRDFQCRSIFDFCNTIRHERTFRSGYSYRTLLPFAVDQGFLGKRAA